MLIYRLALLCALLGLPPLVSAQVTVRVPTEVPYRDVTMIQANVVAECRELGSNMSGYLIAALGAQGLLGERVATLDPKAAGGWLDVKITNLFSSGNAFMGHRKNITVYAEAHHDGRLLGSKVFSRDTMGGPFAGFKGSCTVLERASNALGNDVARWYRGLQGGINGRSAVVPVEPASAASAASAN